MNEFDACIATLGYSVFYSMELLLAVRARAFSHLRSVEHLPIAENGYFAVENWRQIRAVQYSLDWWPLESPQEACWI